MAQSLTDTAIASPVSTQDTPIASGTTPDVLPGVTRPPTPMGQNAPYVGTSDLGNTAASTFGTTPTAPKPPDTFAHKLASGFETAVQELKPGTGSFNRAVMASAITALAGPNSPIANIGEAGTGEYNRMTGQNSNKSVQQTQEDRQKAADLHQASMSEDQLKRAQTQYYQSQAIDLHAKSMREDRDATDTQFKDSLAIVDKARSEGREVIELPGTSASQIADPAWKKAHPEYGDIMKDYVNSGDWTPQQRYSIDPKNPGRYIPDGIYLVHVPSADWNKAKPTETDFKGDKNYNSDTKEYDILAPVPGYPGEIQVVGHRPAASFNTGADLALVRSSNAAVVAKQNDELQRESDKQASLDISRDRVQEIQITEARNVFDKAFPQATVNKDTGKLIPAPPVNDADRSALIAQYNRLVDPDDRIELMDGRPISEKTGLLFGLEPAERQAGEPAPKPNEGTIRQFAIEYGITPVLGAKSANPEPEYIHALHFAGYDTEGVHYDPSTDAATVDISKIVPLTPEITNRISTMTQPEQDVINQYKDQPNLQAALVAGAFGDTPISSFPSRQTKGAPGMIQQEAAGVMKQLNPNWSPALFDTKKSMLKDYTSNNPTSSGGGIGSYNQFIGHAGEVIDKVNPISAQDTRILNLPINSIARYLGNEKLIALQTTLNTAKDEYLNLIKSGKAPLSEEVDAMNTLINVNSTVGQIKTAMDTMAQMGQVRLDALNERWKTLDGQDFPNLVHPDTLVAAKKLGLDLSKYNSGGNLSGKAPQQKLEPAQTDISKQYPTATRIEDGKAYDAQGRLLGPVSPTSGNNAPTSPVAPANGTTGAGGGFFGQFGGKSR